MVLVIGVQANNAAIDLDNKGLAQYQEGNYAQALEYFNQAIDIDPGYVRLWDDRGNMLLYLGRYDEAIDAYNQEIKISKGSGWLGKGYALSHLGMYNEALDAFNQSIQFTDQPMAWVGKALVLSKLGRYEEVKDAINHQVSRGSQNDSVQNFVSSRMITIAGYEYMGLNDIDIQQFKNIFENNSYISGSKSTQVPVSTTGLYQNQQSSSTNNLSPDSDIGSVNSSSNGLPDLTITKLSMKQKSNVIAGTMTIENKGSGDAGKFNITYFLTDTVTYHPVFGNQGIYILGSDLVSGLGAGQTRDSSDFKMFTINPDVPTGPYWTGAFIDAGNDITESDKENNAKYDSDQVIVN